MHDTTSPPWSEGFFTFLPNEFWRRVAPAEANRGGRRVRRTTARPHARLQGAGRAVRQRPSQPRPGPARPPRHRPRHLVEALDHLRQAAHREGLHVEVVHRDMCDLTGLGGFDAAMCLGNSFAYLDVRSAGHFARSLASCLSGGGALMLDDGFVAECLLPHWGEDERAMDAGDITVVSRNTYDPPASRVLSRYRFMRGEEREDKVATHHVLTSGQIVALLEDAGFSGIRLHDGTGPHAFRVGCPRLVVTAQLSR